MKVRMFTPAVLAVTCLIGSAPIAHSQTVPARDLTFMHKAAQGGIAEVRLGELARRRASSDSVRRFGERMVRDHSRANDELMRLARRKRVSLPRSMGAEHRATYNRLSRLSGHAFDRAYMRDMVQDHREDVREFRRASRTVRDPDVRRWAAATLPTLQDHLMMARDILRSVGGRGMGKMGRRALR